MSRGVNRRLVAALVHAKIGLRKVEDLNDVNEVLGKIENTDAGLDIF